VVIARSIISNPKVLMLDEATSALDPNAEKIVQQALNNVAKGRTMIVIAHRLSTIRDADNIIVMAKGETIEQGSHNELIERDGTYSRLVRLQDLGKGNASSDDGEDDTEKDEADACLDPVLSRASQHAIADITQNDGINYGLLKGLWLVIREQRPLWFSGFVLVIISVLGGKVLVPCLEGKGAYLYYFRRHVSSTCYSLLENHEGIRDDRCWRSKLLFSNVLCGRPRQLCYICCGWLGLQ
jgi:ATP-binding cassette subfamily B (MDR/TAP) protein 1